MMDRRAFLGTVAGGLLAAPLAAPFAADAEQTVGGVPRIGVLWPGTPSAQISVLNSAGFRQGLHDRGYVEGHNITVEDRWGNLDNQRIAMLAKELVDLNVDLIVAGGTPAALAAKRATSTIPIVVGAMADPVGDGLVASFGRPGGNVTGVSFLAPQLGSKRLQLLRELAPGVLRVGVLRHPGVYSEPTMREMSQEAHAGAKAIGVELQVFDAKTPVEFDPAFAAMAKARVGAVILFPSPMFYLEYQRLVDVAAKYRLPTMYYFPEVVKAGGLMCYGVDISDLFGRAAIYVDKILKGAKPTDLPVEQPTKFELIINLKTARALGLTIPPSLLQRADQVIE